MGKVFRNGNSLAVTVPKAYAHDLSIRDGSHIEWKKSEDGLLLKHNKPIKNNGVDEKFAKIVEEFMDEHDDVLRKLSHR